MVFPYLPFLMEFLVPGLQDDERDVGKWSSRKPVLLAKGQSCWPSSGYFICMMQRFKARVSTLTVTLHCLRGWVSKCHFIFTGKYIGYVAGARFLGRAVGR
jgi:hypothetical protein